MHQIYTELENLEELQSELNNNPGMIIIKFGATWCGPCKKVESLVHEQINKLPSNIKCFVLDIDKCLDVYAFFKTKRLVSGIPSILAWKKGNVGSIPDNVVCSSNPVQINAFFQKCMDLNQS
jgi:thiol-disulfide isomerase/thioredoxin